MSRTCMLMIAALMLGTPGAGVAADTDAAADLALMQKKAEGNRFFQDMLDQVANNGNGQTNARRQMLRQIMRGSSNRDNLDEPFAYRNAALVQAAQVRGQVVAQILLADLNNDGDVSKDELKTTLQFDQGNQNGQAASAFFSSDADNNEVLSAAEIRGAATMYFNLNGNQRDLNGQFATVIDFDDDGILTKAEFGRAEKALGF